MSDFIGVVDLTVRLSSMNPLGHIEDQSANRCLESAMIQACQTVHAVVAREDPELAARYLDRGMVPYGASDKYFHFERYQDIMLYARTLRSDLIARKLPFKLCVSTGDLAKGSLIDELRTLRASLSSDASKIPEEVGKQITDVFNTHDLAEIDLLLKLYRASSTSRSSVMLSTRLETFKGFGIWIDASLVGHADGVFRNYFPTRGPGQRLIVQGFLDCPFKRDHNDVVIRLTTSSAPASGAATGNGRNKAGSEFDEPATVLSGGQTAMIDDILDLLRRSSKAGDDNAIYYISLLTTIVRSSQFGKIEWLAAQRALSKKKKLAAGWQYYPPIFHTLALDRQHRAMIRKIPGIELTLAAMIDEVHAALTAEPSSATVPAHQPTERNAATLTQLALVRSKDHIFGKVVRHIEATFGVAMMRRIWSAPSDMLNDERKVAMLEVMASK
ncbi:hypothetical protein [Blastomonas aquatica]|uniref:Uncharacterized protein n=1 Tax=Blastomonas aquatica TaxID=1510276 RepID=A0ABQ1J0Q8_9SPHN|nr:hypothetical protein [Blastomonas aquatica]GGB55828.1 hypothetical protein GCM10010833_08160 [Blastomonas aquatica]